MCRRNVYRPVWPLAIFGPLVTFVHVSADALVVTKAMQASTIAEIFVERDQIRLEMEVGQQDLMAFRNILPDEAYESLTKTSAPLSDRIRTFVESDWQVIADSQPLPGRVMDISVRKRVVRDEITGEPLAEQPPDAASVIRIVVAYALAERPDVLTLRSPTSDGDVAATIGFVCYHDGLPINDFRYLPGEVTLDLDWDDPWYSQFRHPNFGRQFNAPLSAYLYVEPYEVRREIIVRPKDLQAWLDLGLDGKNVIAVNRQEELKQKVAAFLAERNSVLIDGQVAKGQLDRIHFVRRTLRTTGIVEPPVDLDVTSATLGIIFVYPIDALPQEVVMQWELFTPRIQTVPAVASDEAGGLPSQITPEHPTLQWTNYLTNPSSTDLRIVEAAPSRKQIQIPWLSLICGVVALAIAGLLLKQRSTNIRSQIPAVVMLACVLIVGVLALPLARVSITSPLSAPAQLPESARRQLVANLLYNVYRSFDHHDESLIYDRLSQSIDGDLLSEVYLETRKSMEVKNQGGLRVSVKQVDVIELEPADGPGAASTFRCRWKVSGWIGHWGHIHGRENEHIAIISVAPREQRWKITAMKLLDEQSFQATPRPTAEAGAGA